MFNQSDTPEQPLPITDADEQTLDQPKLAQSRIPAWNDFCKDFTELLNPSNSSAVSLAYFVRRELRQFNVTSIAAESDVLAEVFCRAYNLIVLGGGVVICHPSAWVRRTAFNYIRELSRTQKRVSSIETQIDIPDRETPPLIDQLILQTDIAILKRSLQELDPMEQKLLTFKVLDELSWAQIRILLASQGKTISEDTLRKQKERALKHLRQVYHSLRPLSELERKFENE